MATHEQAIFRHRRSNNFTIISNDIINNTKMTWRARAILIYLLSKPDDWKVVVQDIINHGPCGRDAVHKALKELKQQGYLKKERLIDPKTNRVVEWRTYVYDSPSQITENQEGGNPQSGKADTTNTDLTKTKEKNTLIKPDNAADKQLYIKPEAEEAEMKPASARQTKAFLSENAPSDGGSFLNSCDQDAQDSPQAQGDRVAQPTGYAVNSNESFGPDEILPLKAEVVPQSSKKLNKRQAAREGLEFDDDGWLQLPYGSKAKLPRWMATRWMQMRLAFDYFDFEWAGVTDEGEIVLESPEWGEMTESRAFDKGGRYTLRMMRDIALAGYGEATDSMSMHWYNETLQAYFESCVNWCQKMGFRAMPVLKERGLAQLTDMWDEDLDDEIIDLDDDDDDDWDAA